MTEVNFNLYRFSLMHWTSQAIIIKLQQFSDDKLLCWLFSETYGLYKGLLSLNKKTRNQVQIGNIVEANWRARLPEHLGTYYCELIKPLPMAILENKHKLSSVTSLCAVLSSCLPERVIESKIYDHCISYFLSLKDHRDWLIDYLKLELELLRELGFGLDLSACAVTGSSDNLYYVSPRTGKAVTKEAGSQYHNKLLRLPSFFIKEELGDREDMIAGFKLTNYFLNKYIYMPQEREFPSARVSFENMIVS